MKINKKLSSEKIDVWECDCGAYIPVKKGSPIPECEYCRRVEETKRIEKCKDCKVVGCEKNNELKEPTAKGFSKAIDKSGLRGFQFKEETFNKGSELDKQIYKEGEPTWGCKYGVLDVEDVKEFIEIITEPLTNLTKPLEKKDYYNFIMEKAGEKLQ